MSETPARTKRLVPLRRVRLSDQEPERLLQHDIQYEEILSGVNEAIVVEEYPNYVHGPSVLVLKRDSAGRILHVPRGTVDEQSPYWRDSDSLSSRRPRGPPFREASSKMIERTTKFIHLGKYAAEVDVDLILDETGWSPYLSHEDALKLDRVRQALKNNDLKAATREAKVFELTELV